MVPPMRNVLVAAVAAAALLVLPAVALAAPSTTLVVSEVQTDGQTPADDFVEITNISATSVPLEGWSLVLRSATGDVDLPGFTFTSQSIPPGGHLLLGGLMYDGTPDADFPLLASPEKTGGAVALKNADGDVVDSVSWGTATTVYVEGSPSPAPDDGESIERDNAGTLDTDDNSSDFAVLGVPTPENGTSPAEPDTDSDTYQDATDTCPAAAHADQADADGDAEGDACDADDDNDGVADGDDAFPTDPTRSTVPVTPTVTSPASQNSQTGQPAPDSGPGTPAGDTAAPALALPSSRMRLNKALRRGVGVRTATDEACTVLVELRLPGKVAKRLRLSRGKSVVVGRATATLAAGGTSTVVVKLSRKARKAFKRLRGVRVGLLVTATDAAGNTALAARWISLRR